MDISRYNKKGIADRQVDTLIGISKGLCADGKINQAETEFLLTWLVQAKSSGSNPLISNLFNHVSEILEDGIVDDQEAKELFATLEGLTGGKTELGEVAKSTTLPLDSPPPKIIHKNKSFLFTGTCVFGTRKECSEAIEKLGGTVAKGVTKKLDYLIIGTYVTDSWIHESFGRKIEKSVQLRNDKTGISIISEELWLQEANL